MDLNKVLAQLTLPEKKLLYSVPERIGGGPICNIGDGRWGGSAIIMALALKENGLNGHVWTIDVYKRHRPKRISQYSTQHGVEHLITRCEGESSEWADRLLDTEFGFTFIDGNHSYTYVLRDAQKAMRNANLIGFHDTNMEDVDRAITDSGILEWELVDHVDKIKIFRRRT